jgi:CxxC-x17-CxxC domain-containing protein
MFEDKTLMCKDPMHDETTNNGPREFVWTAPEQEFYAQKGFGNEPTRCEACRRAKKARFNDRRNTSGPRQMYPAVCASCGRDTEVPFEPRGDKPVYCNDCFANMRQANAA